MSLFFNVTVKAGQIHLEKTGGKYFSLKKTTLPVLVSFDGGQKQNGTDGQVLDNDGRAFKNVVIDNSGNAIDANVQFYIGETPVLFAPSNNSQRADSTTAHGAYVSPGNLPSTYFNTVAAVGVTAPVTGVGMIAAGFNVLYQKKIDNAWNGRTRKSITFTIGSAVATDKVFILDSTLRQFCVVTPAAPLQFESDDIFYAYANSATCDLVIGELYY